MQNEEVSVFGAVRVVFPATMTSRDCTTSYRGEWSPVPWATF